MKPGDCLIIASVDRRSLRHAVSVDWRTEGRHTMPSILPLPNLSVATFSWPDIGAWKTPARSQTVLEGSLTFADEPWTSASSGQQFRRVFRLPILEAPSGFSTNGDGRVFERVCLAECLGETDQVKIYATDNAVSDATVAATLARLINAILPEVEQRIGPIADLDQTGSLTVVLGRLTTTDPNGEEPVLGCVRPSDYLNNDSMAGDIVYLDPRIFGSDAFAPVVAHELAHAAVFSRLRELVNSGIHVAMLPSWLNEAVAHACEQDLFPHSPNLADRIKSWRDDPGGWPLIPRDGRHGAVPARGPERAAGLMFVEFLRQQQSLRELIDAVALGTDSWFHADARAFDVTFRQWTVWMAEHHGKTICQTPAVGDHTLTVAGTSARWYLAEEVADVLIQADASSQLQVTLLRSGPKQIFEVDSQPLLTMTATCSE